jgi:hypothetical protein
MQTSPFRFVHHRLDAYRLARQLADRCKVIADRVPRGYRKWADQLLRAAGSTVGLIGEGANRFTAGQKRQKLTARGCAVLVDLPGLRPAELDSVHSGSPRLAGRRARWPPGWSSSTAAAWWARPRRWQC